MRKLALLGLLAGCAVPVDGGVPIRWLDYEGFVAEVQPVLGRRCGNPTCHGTPERPLALYSVRGWRADPAATYLLDELTEEESRHNYTMSCVFATETGAAAEAPLVLKPLGELAGVYHGGGVVFEGTADRDYRAVLAWIEAGVAP